MRTLSSYSMFVNTRCNCVFVSRVVAALVKCKYFAGWTPLHVAAEGGREDVVEVLLHHKADCSLVTDTGHDHIIMIYINSHFSEGNLCVRSKTI